MKFLVFHKWLCFINAEWSGFRNVSFAVERPQSSNSIMLDY